MDTQSIGAGRKDGSNSYPSPPAPFLKIKKSRKSFCLSKHSHPSISEADYCNWLLARKQNKEIKEYHPYPSLRLPLEGGKSLTWIVDFMVIEKDGSTSYHESKGWNQSDDNFKLKLRMALLLYPDTKFYVNKRLASVLDCGRLAFYDLVGCQQIRARKGFR